VLSYNWHCASHVMCWRQRACTFALWSFWSRCFHLYVRSFSLRRKARLLLTSRCPLTLLRNYRPSPYLNTRILKAMLADQQSQVMVILVVHTKLHVSCVFISSLSIALIAFLFLLPKSVVLVSFC